jgi:hypothetical protein
MNGEVTAVALLLIVPALMLLGLLTVIGLVIVGLSEAEPSGGRLVRPRSEVLRP